MRPDRLLEVRSQERVLRRTVEQMVDSSLVVPSLHVLVPQVVAQLADVRKQFDFQVPEQFIDVPKNYSKDFRTLTLRCSLLEPQLEEQLVEVPTTVSVSSLSALEEQNVDIPVLRGRGGLLGRRGLQGFSQRQNSAAFLGAEHVDNPGCCGEGILEFFVLFTKIKKVGGGSALRSLVHPCRRSAGLAVAPGGFLGGRSWWHVDAVAFWPVVLSVQ